MPIPSQPHDALFRALLDSPRRAGALIRDHLPPDLAARLSADPPRLIDGTFIDGDLKETRSDRLFSVTLTDGRPALLYVLLEHKSTPDPRTPLQLLGYMAAIWTRYAGRDGKRLGRLPPIIPLVFYHGARPWSVPTTVLDCIDADDGLRRWMAGLPYVIRDLGPIAYEELSRERAVRVALGALKYAFVRGDTAAILDRLLADLPDGDALELQILRYIVRVYDTTVDDLGDALDRVKRERRDELMPTIAQQWVQQGRAEGMVAGRAEGKAEILLRQIRRRFGALPAELEARVRAADSDALDIISDRFIDARSLDDLIDDQPH